YTGNDPVMLAAKNNLTTAYNDAQGLTPTDIIGASNIGGFTLPAGVYESPSSILLSGPLTLDGGGDPNATFVFQATSSLTVANGSQVILTDGAQAKNVFWAVGSSATIGTGVDFAGTLMAYTSISVGTGSAISGSLLAMNGAVTLESNAITTTLPAACSDVATPTVVPTGSPAPQPAQHSYFYPSPSRGDSGNIAYNMADRGEVHIKIYNQAAELVDSIDDDEGPGWQTSSVSVQKFAPGVYYFIIEMDYASGATEHDPARGFVVLH
ncbi:MAG TPA: ice-binding family protein, partial [bacterium]|nr:ice-binding family protein [bacterium]